MTHGEVAWFAGVLVTRSSSDREGHTPLFEESVVVVSAASTAQATEKIQALAAAETSSSYRAVDGGRISWQLLHVLDVQELQTAPDDGATVYSRHFRDYDAYRRFEPLLDGSID